MLIFNFTEAAAKHLCPEYRKDKALGFFEPLTTETVEQAFVGSESKEKMVFCLHVVKLGRYHNVIVMEYGTLWCHVIHKVKKGDWDDVFHRFHERWVNALTWMGHDCDLFDFAKMKKGLDNYFSCHKDLRFFVRSDKSCTAHITQIAHEYEMNYRRIGDYPYDEENATLYDFSLNNRFKKRKGASEPFLPKNEMLSLYLREYMGFGHGKWLAAMKKVRDFDKESFSRFVAGVEEEMLAEQVSQLTLVSSEKVSSPSNVVPLFGDATKKTLH